MAPTAAASAMPSAARSSLPSVPRTSQYAEERQRDRGHQHRERADGIRMDQRAQGPRRRVARIGGDLQRLGGLEDHGTEGPGPEHRRTPTQIDPPVGWCAGRGPRRRSSARARSPRRGANRPSRVNWSRFDATSQIRPTMTKAAQVDDEPGQREALRERVAAADRLGLGEMSPSPSHSRVWCSSHRCSDGEIGAPSMAPALLDRQPHCRATEGAQRSGDPTVTPPGGDRVQRPRPAWCTRTCSSQFRGRHTGGISGGKQDCTFECRARGSARRDSRGERSPVAAPVPAAVPAPVPASAWSQRRCPDGARGTRGGRPARSPRANSGMAPSGFGVMRPKNAVTFIVRTSAAPTMPSTG